MRTKTTVLTCSIPRSLSFLFFPFLSFSFLIFPFLSLSFLYSPFLSLSFLFFPFLSLYSFLLSFGHWHFSKSNSMTAPAHVNASWSDFPCSFPPPDCNIYLESSRIGATSTSHAFDFLFKIFANLMSQWVQGTPGRDPVSSAPHGRCMAWLWCWINDPMCEIPASRCVFAMSPLTSISTASRPLRSTQISSSCANCQGPKGPKPLELSQDFQRLLRRTEHASTVTLSNKLSQDCRIGSCNPDSIRVNVSSRLGCASMFLRIIAGWRVLPNDGLGMPWTSSNGAVRTRASTESIASSKARGKPAQAVDAPL